MQINNFNVAGALTAGTVNSQNKSHSDAGVAEGGFAALLRQQNLAANPTLVRAPAPAQFAASVAPPPPPLPPIQAPPPAPARLPAPAPPAASMRAPQSTSADKAPTAASTSKESPTPASTANTRAPQNVKPARTADKSGPAKASQASSTSADNLPVDKTRKVETAKEGDETVTPDPTLAQQIADLRLPAEPAPTALRTGQPPAAKPGAGDPAAADDALGESAKSRGVENTARSDATMKADTKLSDKLARDQGARSASLPVSDFAAAFAELRPAMTPAAQPAAGNDIAATAAAGNATFNLAPGTTRELALAQAVNMPTPVSAPDFAQTLGAQLSVLARDGVQQAELHLNPADMGPVSVHITMDGTQARIDFGADVAATRQVIEAGMPELASALADAGFTLAGGGVSQHPRGRGEGGRGESGSSTGSGPGSGARRVAAGSTDTALASRVIRRTVSAGGVDIYA